MTSLSRREQFALKIASELYAHGHMPWEQIPPAAVAEADRLLGVLDGSIEKYWDGITAAMQKQTERTGQPISKSAAKRIARQKGEAK